MGLQSPNFTTILCVCVYVGSLKISGTRMGKFTCGAWKTILLGKETELQFLLPESSIPFSSMNTVCPNKGSVRRVSEDAKVLKKQHR